MLGERVTLVAAAGTPFVQPGCRQGATAVQRYDLAHRVEDMLAQPYEHSREPLDNIMYIH